MEDPEVGRVLAGREIALKRAGGLEPRSNLGGLLVEDLKPKVDAPLVRHRLPFGIARVALFRIGLNWAFAWTKYATCVPTPDSVWGFEPMLWGRKANRSWNGLKTIHGRSSWGRLRFDIKDDDRRQIIRALLFRARKDYEAEKTCYGAQDGVLAHWQNEEVGDPAFYESVLKPVVERLDAAAAKVTFEMDDATVDELERTALPAWHNFRFDVQRLRADYLGNRLVP